LDARYHKGFWRLRIDDLDTPRNVTGATDAILHCLQRFGLQWDGEVYFQSQHLQQYQQSLAKLQRQEWLYACRCSRKKLANSLVYPGYCRQAGFPDDHTTALRLKTQDLTIEFDDALQGNICQNLALEQGDFVIRRRDQIIAYQFAVVIDDNSQGISHVVRGADLLDSTPKQIYLQQLLGYSTPHYLHLPLIVDEHGEKLSKQTLAAPIDDSQPTATLFFLLKLLQQNPPENLLSASVQQQLNWAIAHWQPQALQKVRAIQPPIL